MAKHGVGQKEAMQNGSALYKASGEYKLKETIKQIIKEFHDQGLSTSKDATLRDVQIPQLEKVNKALVITGPRRCGKTFLVYQLIREAMREGKAISDFLYVNFEDERLIGMAATELGQVLEAYGELYPEKKPVFALDEVQNVNGWDRFVRRLVDAGYKVLVTGSNSKLLSQEIATSLRGRCVTVQLLPFSFKEFLTEKKVKLEENWQYGSQRFQVKNLFEAYFNLSGFPEIVRENKLSLIDDYVKTVFYRDVIERYQVNNKELMRLLMQYVASIHAQNFSINKFNNIAKSQGHTSSTSTIHEYMKILENVFYCFFATPRKKSLKKQYGKKVYPVDQGVVNYQALEKDSGRLLEDLVFLELTRRGKKPSYLENGFECDFITEDTAIQVTFELNENSKDREINGLIEAAKQTNASKLLIITRDQEDLIKTQGFKIRVVPAWKWLLE